jgi:4-diphosphocytidyl-2-C-methyl-D-erythritol kinase
MIRVFAPAKINLSLQVGAPRADGMHPLRSVVAFADVGDWIEAAAAEDLSLRVTGPFANALADEADNLVLRAARALGDVVGAKAGAAITLEKNLPIASGIGGGSSDAAATLKALNALWGAGLSEDHLMQIGRGLGADVPACIGARAARMSGIGEIVAPVDLEPLHAVLVNPLVPAPTGAVYKAFDTLGIFGALDVDGEGNDLFAAACTVAPILADMHAELSADRRARRVALSGSGGTMFVIVDDALTAAAFARDVARSGWWVRPAKLG